MAYNQNQTIGFRRNKLSTSLFKKIIIPIIYIYKMGLLKKRQSKRISLKDRYKIQKKVNEHNRKQRRAAKKDDKSGATARRALRKDPGIPNLWPFKEQLLRQIEAKKERDEERRKSRAEEVKRLRAGPTEEELANAAERAEEHAMREEEQEGAAQGRHAGSVLKSVVEDADIIIQVLDARDPQGCRSPQIEDMVRSKGKRMVLVLNKTDLVTEQAVRGWVKFLRRQYPCIPFAANTQKQKNNLKRVPGADELIKLLKGLAKGSKASLVVGIVGVPNVGKSSLVNSLKMSRAVTASAQAGSTKTNQRVAIDSKLELIDTPGVSTPFDPSKISRAVAALRACLEPVVEDPLKAVEDLVRESPQDRFMIAYGLPKFDNPRDFLVRLATQTGKISKGGVLNLESAARLVVHDCQKGKFKLYCQPPEDLQASTGEEAEEAEVMDTLGDEFEFVDEDDAMGL